MKLDVFLHLITDSDFFDVSHNLIFSDIEVGLIAHIIHERTTWEVVETFADNLLTCGSTVS